MYQLITNLATWFCFGAVITLMIVSCVKAETPGDVKLTVPLASYHFNHKSKYNEDNFGVGIEYQMTRSTAAKAVIFDNSNNIKSTFLGVFVTPEMTSIKFMDVHYKAGFLAGKVTGYSIQPLWIALPAMKVEFNDHHGVNITGVPHVRGQEGGIGFEYTYRF